MEVNEVQEQMKAVQRMQEYIEEHLEEEITLANLSEVSLFSSWHSYRLFKNYLQLMTADLKVWTDTFALFTKNSDAILGNT